MMSCVAIAGYRSLRDIRLPLGRLTIVTGSNGSGKSSQHGLLRSLRASELSDGTLRYLLLSAALLSPRPPALMVLNEPETSLHPDLLGPLARLIAQAAERSQILVVTHAEALLRPLQATGSARHIRLDKQFGETSAPDVDAPSWAWPTR